ncbi:UDP-N-acetylmuramoylalanyl-D-glutamate--2,6-diaminopimelate ligase [Franzmannia pantelleriensis]|uniref:UDP-N-acetylmuramoyl-L-alanyl-D-glutamate--2,6-diaminopimelate ligase n=1 Tax=Franzmannia pantelleriensis TaxID=48727 RepID=A0A1G9NN61_9GAMM|nr:UDP-N-acetylmuramoyl-L-alanyl-D-glutamate--2,6-diaminopimelate ligase [Halomonas pantelleriensis]SDL87829.1 UDP-N-acetylmuramoylalanyl-D-glutamate--2,6-diaminopimelate ligase [Halomonas pantelleriensis]
MQVDRQRLSHALSSRWPDATVSQLPRGDDVRLELDSRRLAAGDLFVALPGVSADGRDFVDAALAAGVGAVLYHLDDGDTPPPDPRVLGLPGLKAQLGALGRELFGVPESLELIGVTGTNGKSSVTHYIAALSETLGRACGVIGTLGVGRIDRLADSGQTTPGPLALQAALGELAAQGVVRVAMEVSSHALDQGRLAGCRVTAGVFTNLSRDHLDYHPSMAAYAAAKAQLFKRDELELAVVNGDDPLARLMLAGVSERLRVLACGQDEATTLRVVEWLPHADGQRALIATPLGERVLALGLMGRFNLDNVLLAIATLYGLGEDLDALLAAAESLAPVPGRMQRLAAPGGPRVVIDYAHTPDALDNALRGLREHLGETATLWCLFGCGGDRDPGKRSLMGRVAESLAGRVVITDDNPRGETPAAIRAAIRAGLSAPSVDSVWEIDGRGAAIAHTLAAAGPEDIVLIAGKGHETYQEIAGVRHDFNDLTEAEAALAKRSERP